VVLLAPRHSSSICTIDATSPDSEWSAGPFTRANRDTDGAGARGNVASDDHVAAALNAFAKELTQNSRADVYDYLEAERIKYAIRLPMNRVLQERIGYLLKRPVDRPSNDVRRYHASFTIRPKAGRERAVSSPRSSGIRASFIRASASSSPTWRGPPRMWSPSTIGAAIVTRCRSGDVAPPGGCILTPGRKWRATCLSRSASG
jgi:hypothetical protein